MRQEINPGKTGTNRAAHKGTQTDTLTKGKTGLRAHWEQEMGEPRYR